MKCPWCEIEFDYQLTTCWDDYLDCPTCKKPIEIIVDGGYGVFHVDEVRKGD